MLRSRAITPGFKFFFALAVFALSGAFVAGVGGELGGADGVSNELASKGFINVVVGSLTLGWKGGIGDHLAYTFFVSLAVVAGSMAALTVAFRDADPESVAELVSLESAPLTKAPNGTSYLPLAGAFALVLITVGWVTDRTIMLGGFVALAGVIVAWMVRAWAERATGDDAVNREIYDRILGPVRVPILATATVGFVAFAVSRLLLSLDKTEAVIAFSLLGLYFFGVAIFVGTRPHIGRNLMVAAIGMGVAVIVIVGIAGVAGGTKSHGGEGGHSGGTEAPAEPATGEN
jgi:hypothetical protein